MPVLDVRGRLLLGFDPARVEALLGATNLSRRGAAAGFRAAALSAPPRWSCWRPARRRPAWSTCTWGATAGGLTGWGTTPNTPDFFDSTRGPSVGFDMGLKVLFVDLSASFLQVLSGSGRSGTLIQLLLGGEVDVPLGSARLADGEPVHVLQPKLAGGLGFGTPGPVKTPYNDAQVSAKGIVGDAILGYSYYLDPLVAVGAEATFGYHYFFGGDVVNASEGHSSGYHVVALGTVTFHLGL